MNYLIILSILLIVLFVIFIGVYIGVQLDIKKGKNEMVKLKTIENRYDILEEMTLYINNIVEKNDIKLIPSYGTLLGLEREKKILEHDYDSDFFIIEDDWSKLKNVLEKEDKYKLKILNILWHKKLLLIDKSGISMDLCILHNNNKTLDLNMFLAFSKNSSKNGSFLWKTPTRVKFKKDMFLPLQKKSTKYGEFYFPNKTDELLTYWYDDWKTPVVY